MAVLSAYTHFHTFLREKHTLFNSYPHLVHKLCISFMLLGLIPVFFNFFCIFKGFFYVDNSNMFIHSLLISVVFLEFLFYIHIGFLLLFLISPHSNIEKNLVLLYTNI